MLSRYVAGKELSSMKKIKVGICIEDPEFERRFTNCLIRKYSGKLELNLFTGLDQFISAEKEDFDIVLMGDCVELVNEEEFWQEIKAISEQISKKIVYLVDLDEFPMELVEEGDVIVIEKYQEVNQIVDEILRQVGSEIRDMKKYGEIKEKTKVLAVYSLTENEFQLPFAVTLASILGEKHKVLILDLQENSGFTQLLPSSNSLGLEELVVMAESGKYSYGRLVSCIGHMEKADYVYPMTNTENICEMNSDTYLKLIQMICNEMDYQIIIINLGARFIGFFCTSSILFPI